MIWYFIINYSLLIINQFRQVLLSPQPLIMIMPLVIIWILMVILSLPIINVKFFSINNVSFFILFLYLLLFLMCVERQFFVVIDTLTPTNDENHTYTAFWNLLTTSFYSDSSLIVRYSFFFILLLLLFLIILRSMWQPMTQHNQILWWYH